MADPRKRIVARAYDRIARRYLEWGGTIDGDPRHDLLARFAGDLAKGARVLELGCGAGIPSTVELASRFRVVGVDISAAQVELARREVPDAEFIQADFLEFRFADASFDGVAALYSISHVPREQHGRLFADVFRWLVPGGSFSQHSGLSTVPIGSGLG